MQKKTEEINLIKRARAKYFTLAFLYPLIDLESANIKKYWSAWHCSRILLVKHYVKHSKVEGRYCKQRFCTVCNRIHTANYIKGYAPVIEKFPEPTFLTLTLPNCTGVHLRNKLIGFQAWFRYMNRVAVKDKMKLAYLRKIEITYNKDENTFHPHLHLVCFNAYQAYYILGKWYNTFGAVISHDAQDVRPCDKSAKIELFKYFTDVVKKRGGKYEFEPAAFDIILTAIRKIRIFQPVGVQKVNLPKQNSIFGLQIDELIHETEYVYWDSIGNWIGLNTKNLLTSYRPSKKFKQMCENIHYNLNDYRPEVRHNRFLNPSTYRHSTKNIKIYR